MNFLRVPDGDSGKGRGGVRFEGVGLRKIEVVRMGSRDGKEEGKGDERSAEFVRGRIGRAEEGVRDFLCRKLLLISSSFLSLPLLRPRFSSLSLPLLL